MNQFADKKCEKCGAQATSCTREITEGEPVEGFATFIGGAVHYFCDEHYTKDIPDNVLRGTT